MTQNYNTNTEKQPEPSGFQLATRPQKNHSENDPASEKQTPQQALLQGVRLLTSEVGELRRESPGLITDELAHWLAANYVLSAKEIAAESNGAPMGLKTLGALSAPLVALRNGDHSAAWLNLRRDRLEFDRWKDRRKILELFKEWSGNEKVKETLASDESYEEQIKALGNEIFGEGWDK